MCNLPNNYKKELNDIYDKYLQLVNSTEFHCEDDEKYVDEILEKFNNILRQIYNV